MPIRDIQILYFASLREQLDRDRETIALTGDLKTISDICQLLAGRGGAWKGMFDGSMTILYAVNQQIARRETEIKPGDELAFFPPVTGG